MLQYEKEPLLSMTPFVGIPKCLCKQSPLLISVHSVDSMDVQ